MPAHYLVASRQGLFRVSRSEARLLVEGRFFGIVFAGDELFAFRHGSRSDPEGPNSGRILRYRWKDGALVEAGAVVEGLDRNCHQIDFFDGSFFVVDTFNQSILEYDDSWRPLATHQILPPAVRDGPDHAHLNSIAGSGSSIWVMLHNGHRGLPSEIWEFDRAFRERKRIVLPCSGCHDLVPLPDGRLLTCLSPRGEIQAVPGETSKIDDYWTRGLALGPDEIAVGSSFYGARFERTLLPGFLTFLDPAFKRVARIYLPGAPTQIRLMSGRFEGAEEEPKSDMPPGRG